MKRIILSCIVIFVSFATIVFARDTEIKIPNSSLDDWIDIHGTYKINKMEVTPIASTIDKDEEGNFILYQVFDTSEINLKNNNAVTIEVNIKNICLLDS